VSARITPQTPALQALRMRLHAQHQPVVLMRTDCHVCRAEGLAPRSQVLIIAGDRTVQALLYQIDSDLLKAGQIALSEAAWDALDIHEGDFVQVRHPPMLESLSAVRARIHGHRLQTTELQAIVRDVVDGRYTDVALSAFLTATAVLPLDMQETIHLTRAMVDVGDHLQWQAPIVVDKHCVGGLPGNRTTPLVVAIAAANGLVMPKTSSRAITSPAGTADTMETLAPVDLDLDTLRKVVEKEGGCVAWGGAMHLSPADDIFVRIERELDIDTQGQLIASVLSKKIAAGATHRDRYSGWANRKSPQPGNCRASCASPFGSRRVIWPCIALPVYRRESACRQRYRPGVGGARRVGRIAQRGGCAARPM